MDNLDFNFFCAACKKSKEYRTENCFANYRVKRFKRGDYLAFKEKVISFTKGWQIK